ncbi:MAG: carboxymuconolactone decarboxylase family protein [Paludibacter sp.]|nr:carboxymuconolactone decarboxylase family protein [Paludibacter sp.]
MSITSTAQQNHEELFPNHKSTLKETDPEFIVLFDNFAFDEVMANTKLDSKTRVMMMLGSTIGCQALGEYRVLVGAALNVGITPVQIKEILYQAVPYVGIAKAFDFLHTTNEVMQSRGIALPLEEQSTTTPQTRFEKGLEVQKTIFGDRIDDMYKQSPANQLHIQKLLSANCFGDYYTRTGLDLKTRELLTFSILLSLGGCEPQLKGHVQGNLNIGNDKDLLIDVVTQLLPYVGYPRTLNALRCINEISSDIK